MRTNLRTAFFWPLCTLHRSLTFGGNRHDRRLQREVFAKVLLAKPARVVPALQRNGAATADPRLRAVSNSGG